MRDGTLDSCPRSFEIYETLTTMIPDKMNALLDTSSAAEVLASDQAPRIASAERQLTEAAKYEISFIWIRTALHYAAELLRHAAVLFAILYFLGVVAICVAILFYTFCR